MNLNELVGLMGSDMTELTEGTQFELRRKKSRVKKVVGQQYVTEKDPLPNALVYILKEE